MKDRSKKICCAIFAVFMIVLSIMVPVSAATYEQFYFNGDIALRMTGIDKNWNYDSVRKLPNVGTQIFIANNCSVYFYDGDSYSNNIYRVVRIIMINNVVPSSIQLDTFYPVFSIEMFKSSDTTGYPSYMLQVGYYRATNDSVTRQKVCVYDPEEGTREPDTHTALAFSFADTAGASMSVKSLVSLIGMEILTRDGYNLYWTGGYYTGYDKGQTDGYQDGLTDGYNEGYNGPDGYSLGYEYGYESGAQQGYADAKAVYDNSEAWKNMKNVIFAMYDAPFYIIQESLDFDIFGINIAATIIGLISLSIIVFVLSFVIQKFF